MRGAVPPLPQYAIMAWCSVKSRGQLYLTASYPVPAVHKVRPVDRFWPWNGKEPTRKVVTSHGPVMCYNVNRIE